MKIESITLHHISMPLVSGKDIIDTNDFQQRMEGIRGHYLVKAGQKVDETSAVRRACPTLRGLKLNDDPGEVKIE
jgi:hypothetical protein